MISAMIFAAGKGRRLGELGKRKPKALLDVQGEALLSHCIRSIQSAGIEHIVVNVHHLKEQIVDFLRSNDNFGVSVDVSEEDPLLETGGGLKHAKRFLENSEHILLHNVDIFSEIDLKTMLSEHMLQKNLVTLAVQKRESSRNLLFDSNGTLCGWRNNSTGAVRMVRDEKALEAYAFSGVHCMSADYFKYVCSYPEEIFSIIDVYLHYNELAPFLRAYDIKDTVWHDLGTQEKLDKVNQQI